MSNSILNTRKIRQFKQQVQGAKLQMLTCYDFQTAQLLNETSLDLILVGDSLGNVILGYDNTIQVTIAEMIIFSAAVKRGAKNKFVIADLPFGSYFDLNSGLENAIKLFQKSGVEAVKLEGAFPYQLELISRLTQVGIPVMGHIGLTPQSVHEQGGYFTHGKDENSKNKLIQAALALEQAGVFALVLECVEAQTAAQITEQLSLPTIGIGSGNGVDGDVLVINDLLNLGLKKPPQFVSPIADIYQVKKNAIDQYLIKQNNKNIKINPAGLTREH